MIFRQYTARDLYYAVFSMISDSLKGQYAPFDYNSGLSYDAEAMRAVLAEAENDPHAQALKAILSDGSVAGFYVADLDTDSPNMHSEFLFGTVDLFAKTPSNSTLSGQSLLQTMKSMQELSDWSMIVGCNDSVRGRQGVDLPFGLGEATPERCGALRIIDSVFAFGESWESDLAAKLRSLGANRVLIETVGYSVCSSISKCTASPAALAVELIKQNAEGLGALKALIIDMINSYGALSSHAKIMEGLNKLEALRVANGNTLRAAQEECYNSSDSQVSLATINESDTNGYDTRVFPESSLEVQAIEGDSYTKDMPWIYCLI